MQQAVYQFGVTQRRFHSFTSELEESRVNLEQALRAKRQAEQLHEEAVVRVNELTTINVNLASAKSKLESEFSALQNDYDEVHKELRVSIPIQNLKNFFPNASNAVFRSPTNVSRS